jgi:hypothetical protein
LNPFEFERNQTYHQPGQSFLVGQDPLAEKKSSDSKLSFRYGLKNIYISFIHMIIKYIEYSMIPSISSYFFPNVDYYTFT